MSNIFADRTYWIVGASEGLGAALADKLSNEGANVVLSARSADKLKAVASKIGVARTIALDVTDATSVQDAIQQAEDIDGVIYCVGQYHPMKTQDWDLDKSLQVIDANYLGAVRLFAGVAPEFLRRGHGHIVVIGSLAGFHGLPSAIGYSSSKGAVMQLCENMYMDAHGTDVKVQQINPGYIETRLSVKNDFSMPQIMTAQLAADRVLKAMTGSRFRTSFPAPFAWLFTVGRLLPSRLYRWVFSR